MVLLYRCKLGEGMNRFRNWHVLEEKVTGNGITRVMISDIYRETVISPIADGITRVMINDKNEIAKFHFMSGKDIDGVGWDLVFFCGRVDNQMVLF